MFFTRPRFLKASNSCKCVWFTRHRASMRKTMRLWLHTWSQSPRNIWQRNSILGMAMVRIYLSSKKSLFFRPST